MEMIIENILKQLAHRKYSIISSHFYYKVKLENISIDFFSKQQMLQELKEGKNQCESEYSGSFHGRKRNITLTLKLILMKRAEAFQVLR